MPERRLLPTLKAVYTAVDGEAAKAALAEFEDSDVTQCYLSTVATWRRAWSEVIPLHDYAQTDLV